MRRREFIGAVGGAVLLAPLAARAQSKLPVVGFLNSTSPVAAAPNLAAFRQGLKDAGYAEGESVRIEYRWAEGHYDRMPGLAASLVAAKVDVIATSGGDRSAVAAKGVTSTVPIVAVIGGDPVAEGLVASLARPGGNLTGVSFLTASLTSKRLELLAELAREAKVVGLLVNPDNLQTDGVLKDAREAARLKGLELQTLEARMASEIDAAFSALAQRRTSALVVQADPFFNSRREQLVALSSRHGVPAIYEWRGFPEAGGLISYGTSLAAVYRQVGVYAGKILRGAKPEELPVMQPTEFELVINLKTAKALGLMVPQSLLSRADDIIE